MQWLRDGPRPKTSHVLGVGAQQSIADDLETIAEGWGVPVATAVWAIVVEQLARWRRQAPDLGPHGLAIAAAATVLQRSPCKLHVGHPVGTLRQRSSGGLHDNP